MVELILLILILLVQLFIVLKLLRPETIHDDVVLLKEHARKLEDAHNSLERLFLIPQQRGVFGETSLEALLSNSLSANSFAIRKQYKGFIPDAQIFLGDETILIDSKFPLTNYDNDPKLFARDLKLHFEKLSKYPTDLVFMYIPSETVYYTIIKDHYNLVLSYAERGVQVVSPLTLSHKLQLLKSAIQAKKISEEANKVILDISNLKSYLQTLSQEFSKLNSHVRKAYNKLPDLEFQISKIKDKLESY